MGLDTTIFGKKTVSDVLKEIYDNSRHIIFLHTAYNPRFNCLHFHIVKKENYKREYSANEKGSFIIQDIFIDTLIHFTGLII